MAVLCGVCWLALVLLQVLVYPRETLQQRSSPGYVFESDEYFYKVVFESDDTRSFYEAEEICSEFENGHLASITSQAENEWLHRKIQSVGHNRVGRFWVGASDKRQYGSFEWIDGKPFVFFAAHYLGARSQYNKQDYEMCLSLKSSSKDVQWTNEDCYDARGYICKTEGVPKRLTAKRRFGYEFEDNIWTYKFIFLQDDMLSWPEAEVYCRRTEWGNLLSLTDVRDTKRVVRWLQQLRHVFGFSKLWIGASDLAREGHFTWTDGKPFNYTKWKVGEPSGTYRGLYEDCAAISGHPYYGQWSDEYCLNNQPFICKTKMCGERTDLSFAIDASGSMGYEGFSKAKRFIKALSSSFKISTKGTHVGLIRFSTRSKVMFNLAAFSSHTEVNDAIDDMEWTEGGTKTELALRMARQQLYSKRGGMRREFSIFKLFILLTDGRSENPTAVAREALLLRQLGVHVMAVGIGKYTNKKELESIATSKDDVIGVVSFRDLMIRMNEIKDKLCEVANSREKADKLLAKAKARAQAQITANAQAKAQTPTRARAQAQARARAQAQAKAKAQAQARAKAQAQAKARAQAQARARTQAQARARAQAQARARAQAQARARARAQAQARARARAQAQARARAQAQARARARAQAQARARAQSRSRNQRRGNYRGRSRSRQPYRRTTSRRTYGRG